MITTTQKMSIKVLDVLILNEFCLDGDYVASSVEDHLVTSYQSLSILITNTLAAIITFDSQILDECSIESLRSKMRCLRIRNKVDNDCPLEYFPIFEKAWQCENKFKRISIRIKERFLDKHWFTDTL